tara:strand:+ start:691 stop:903 length:213 start_codon:yes stop_codon:yes gene_type:complete
MAFRRPRQTSGFCSNKPRNNSNNTLQDNVKDNVKDNNVKDNVKDPSPSPNQMRDSPIPKLNPYNKKCSCC